MTAVTFKTSTNVVTKSVQYQYDALGRRIGKSVDETGGSNGSGDGTMDRTESFIYDGAGMLADASRSDKRWQEPGATKGGRNRKRERATKGGTKNVNINGHLRSGRQSNQQNQHHHRSQDRIYLEPRQSTCRCHIQNVNKRPDKIGTVSVRCPWTPHWQIC